MNRETSHSYFEKANLSTMDGKNLEIYASQTAKSILSPN